VLGLDTESEALLVYMKKDLYRTADIRIFEVEEIREIGFSTQAESQL